MNENEDAFLEMEYEDRFVADTEEYWEDDLYQYNQNEADDYRHEMDEF